MVPLRQLKVPLILPFVWVMALLACIMQPASAAVWHSQAQPPAINSISSKAASSSFAASGSGAALATSPALGSRADAWSEGGTFVASVAARTNHTAVWTGTEMIIWGGRDPNSYLNTGGRYNPTTGVWTPISTINAPAARAHHTAVWTGTEMIVWGGYVVDLNSSTTTYFNNGGRYNPATDTWTPLSLTGAPLARADHTAVWTGSSPTTGEMIVWGGNDLNTIFNTGGRYNPRTDTWTTISTTKAPSARSYHTAVWTGAKMVVWGGFDFTNTLATGGLYDPAANTWAATADAGVPAARYEHTAVWTGTYMVVWGGYDNSGAFNTGGRYNPSTNTWSTVSTTSAPAARVYHTAVWTGTYMVIWGGFDLSSYLNTGGIYNPSADTWSTVNTTGAPAARAYHTAVWTGTEMIVWTGSESAAYFNTGGRYNPIANTWAAMILDDAPSARYEHTAVWTGTEMIIWGGDASNGNGFFNTGGRYNPTTNTWRPISTTNAPSARFDHTAVWTGTEMIIWGGMGSSGLLNTGARYNPDTDTWTPMSTTNVPTARSNHTAIWTGGANPEMIVWGGGDDTGVLNTGARYNPSTNIWTTMSTTGAPDARDYHTAVWTGTEMIVWGGENGAYLNTGGRYNPGNDTWSAISTTNAPSARYAHTALWTGGTSAQGEMIIWGGSDDSGVFNTGGRYNPVSNTWLSTTTTNAPSGRAFHSAVWATGRTNQAEMIVWGGGNDGVYFNTGGRYDPTTNTWFPINTTGAISARSNHTAIYTGTEMIVWGGITLGGVYNTGGRYETFTYMFMPIIALNGGS